MIKTKNAASDVPDIRRARPELSIRCGSCLFLTRYHTYGVPCDQLGTVPSSIPCARFTPDPRELGDARNVRDVLRTIGEAKNAQLLTSILLGARRVRRHGYAVGDVVYFRVMGADYLGNYAHGVVTGCTPKALVVMGVQGFVGLITVNDVMNRAAFELRRAALIARDRINDPGGGLRRITTRGATRLVVYEPPAVAGSRRSRGPRSSFGGKRRKPGTPIVISTGDER